jgi:hypothetical protein
MHRVLFIAAALTVALTTPALAFQCPKLVGEINSMAGNRFDAAANNAKAKAAEAQKLHNEGKHAEAEKAAKEGLTLLGKKM